jgi:hypothetical protein
MRLTRRRSLRRQAAWSSWSKVLTVARVKVIVASTGCLLHNESSDELLLSRILHPVLVCYTLSETLPERL